MAEYIEKEHLLDFLDACIEEEKGTRHQVIVEAIKMTVERIPSANVIERKKGKWEDNTKDESWKCSECGFIFYSVGFYKIYNTKFRMRFCPNCGARMDGDDDG